MPIKTAEEAAWEENFTNDIIKINKELLILINKQMPGDQQFRIFPLSGAYVVGKSLPIVSLEDKNKNILIELSSGAGYQKNPKIIWSILLRFSRLRHGNDLVYNIPVSHRDVYTRKELERAKNSILVKILGYIKKYY